MQNVTLVQYVFIKYYLGYHNIIRSHYIGDRYYSMYIRYIIILFVLDMTMVVLNTFDTYELNSMYLIQLNFNVLLDTFHLCKS